MKINLTALRRDIDRLKGQSEGDVIADVQDAIAVEPGLRKDGPLDPKLERLLGQVEADLAAYQALSDDERELRTLRLFYGGDDHV